MAGKIFYRERRKVGKEEKKPRFKIVAVADVDLTVYADHLRKQELDQIAESIGAELVLLESGKGSEKEVRTSKMEARNMAGKIFYRERRKVGKDEKKPRFKMVAVSGVDLKVYANHLRRQELTQIAESIGAEMVLLKGGKEGKEEEVEVKG